MSQRYVIVEDRTGKTGYCPRGAAKELWQYKGPEVMLSGPAETGKTFSSCQKLDALLWKYPRSQAVVVRKVRATMHGSVLQTYRKVIGADSPILGYGGEKVEFFSYPNGSRLWVAGMDNPGKALSSERDFVYVNQAEELTLTDWETLVSRATGRAGNAPYPQLLGDCNPGPPHHWIKHRPSLKLLESRHEDNPTLWDASRGEWTEQGIRTIAALDSLTGIRKERLRYGRWVAAEGVVYEEYDPRYHLIDPFPIPRSWVRYWSVDFGYTNPFVWQNWAEDGDGRVFLTREIYHTGKLVEDHARRILRLCGAVHPTTGKVGHWQFATEPKPRLIVCDHDAEDRATLEHHLGLRTVGAWKDVSPGIQSVAARFRPAGDGHPRLFIFKDALDQRDPALDDARRPACTAEEIESYSWDTSAGRKRGEQPTKQDDHGVDALRYLVYRLDRKDPAMSQATPLSRSPVLRGGMPASLRGRAR